MKRIYSHVTATALAALTTFTAFAQGNVDIGLHQNGQGQLEVKVRPQADFDGIFSALVFTIRWDRNSGATLGEPIQADATLQTMPLIRSGNARENGTYNYQIYAGFGFQTLSSAGTSWTAGNEYTLMTIPVTGAAEFELLNDAWTGELQNNGDYYVSLGGVDRTGVIYKSLASPVSMENSVSIQPNPNEGEFTFSFTVGDVSDIQVEVLNTLGQSIFSDNLKSFEGTYRREMDLTALSNGIYYLKISRQGESSVHKIVYR